MQQPVSLDRKSAIDVSLKDALERSDEAAVEAAAERAKRAGFPASDVEAAVSWWRSQSGKSVDSGTGGALLTATADLLVQAEWNGFVRLPEEVRVSVVNSMVQIQELGQFPSDLRAIRILGMLESPESVAALKRIALSADKQKVGLAVRALAESCEASAAAAISELRPRIDADPSLQDALKAGAALRDDLRRCK